MNWQVYFRLVFLPKLKHIFCHLISLFTVLNMHDQIKENRKGRTLTEFIVDVKGIHKGTKLGGIEVMIW